MVVREDDDLDLEEASKHASILQNKQLITNNVINKRKVGLACSLPACMIHRPRPHSLPHILVFACSRIR
ncbi:hypothetical protein Aduo_005374 [Ancylostoma duodenale]